MEIYARNFISDPPSQNENAKELIAATVEGNAEELVDSKLKTAVKVSRDSRNDEGLWNKSVLESNAIQEISK